MNDANTMAPKWLVILAIVMAIWNLLGVMAFIMQQITITMTA